MLDVYIIILEHNDVLSLQTVNLNPQEKGCVDGFPHPFSKSCPCVVPVEYAALLCQSPVRFEYNKLADDYLQLVAYFLR